MAKWGKCDFKQLERLNKNMEKLMGADLDRFCRQAAQELAGRLLNKVVKRTPVVYGTLRDAWAVMPVGHRGTHYTVVVLNNLQYASYVEYGHRQQPGRFIPGYWESDRFVYDPDAEGGMVLKKNWVKGRYMLTISTQELEQQAVQIVDEGAPQGKARHRPYGYPVRERADGSVRRVQGAGYGTAIGAVYHQVPPGLFPARSDEWSGGVFL